MVTGSGDGDFWKAPEGESVGEEMTEGENTRLTRGNLAHCRSFATNPIITFNQLIQILMGRDLSVWLKPLAQD